MLNRRLIRVKAFKAIFSYGLLSESALNMAKDKIAASFLVNLMSEVPEDKKELEGMRSIALIDFENRFKGNTEDLEVENTRIYNTVLSTYENYLSILEKDKKIVEQNAIYFSENIQPVYLTILKILLELKKMVFNDFDEKINKSHTHRNTPALLFKFKDHPILEKIKEAEEIQAAFKKHAISVAKELASIKTLYKSQMLEHPTYQAYCRKSEPSQAEHLEILQFITRELIIKGDILIELFENLDIDWEDNEDVYKDMVYKTFQNTKSDEPLLPAQISLNWEEDKEFLKRLIKAGINNYKQNNELIGKNLQNWNLDRISSMERAILILGLAEMIEFPNIPIKVTINEYIEVTKMYGTLGSNIFVNGLLDRISKELVETGGIKKSGRGLIE